MEYPELDQFAFPGAYGTKRNLIMRPAENCVLKSMPPKVYSVGPHTLPSVLWEQRVPG